jgi:hypothetical protein
MALVIYAGTILALRLVLIVIVFFHTREFNGFVDFIVFGLQLGPFGSVVVGTNWTHPVHVLLSKKRKMPVRIEIRCAVLTALITYGLVAMGFLRAGSDYLQGTGGGPTVGYFGMFSTVLISLILLTATVVMTVGLIITRFLLADANGA